MQLVNMEVDRLGTHQRCNLGPFSPGLNAICGPRGSGKTTLLSWLRQIAAETYGLDYAVPAWNAHHIPVRGTVEIRDRGRTFRAIQSADGHTQHHALGGPQSHDHGYTPTVKAWLSPTQRDAFSALCAAQGAADTEVELIGIARRLGLDVSDIDAAYRDQRGETAHVEQLEATRRQLAGQLRELERLDLSQEQLVAKRDRLEAELARLRTTRQDALGVTDTTRMDARWASAQDDLAATKQEIARIDSQIAERQADLKLFETDNCIVEVTQSYREQLQQIDDRLSRWRRTLADICSHRERIESSATDARLDEQVGDQLSATRQPDPRGALRALEASLVASRKQLDDVVGRLGQDVYTSSGEYDVVRLPGGETRLVAKDTRQTVQSNSELPELLRSMQKDLYEACQQLSRQQSQAARENLSTQAGQLKRCENELTASIERLIEQRAALLSRIASEHNLSVDRLNVAFGQWSQSPDHPNLAQWLRDEELSNGPRQTHASMADRQRILEEIEGLRTRRNELELHCENCRRHLRDSDDYRLRVVLGQDRYGAPSAEQEILDELNRLTADLGRLSDRDRLTAQLREVELQLARPQRSSQGLFSASVNSHIKAIMGPLTRAQADHSYRNQVPRQYDQVDGVVYDLSVAYETYEKRVPEAVVKIAQRLAIAESLAARSEPVSLILDGTLDDLSATIQGRVISHLANVCQRGQQVIVMTSDERVAQEVRSHRGWVAYMPTAVKEVVVPDVNQELAAFANEEEADKWYRVRATERAARTSERSGYYLTESSLIAELPSIDTTSATRLRQSGVETIGDLLDADTDWLSDRIEVRESTIMRWQAEADLLCSVRNLRPFDARVLVGAGVRSSTQLASVHPSKLLARVEDFLKTDYGRRILSSGSRYELTRITAWIAAAKSGSQPNEFVVSEREERSERSYTGTARSSSRTRSRNGESTRRSQSGSARGDRFERDGRSSTRRSRSERSEQRRSGQRDYSVVGSSSSSASSRSSSQTESSDHKFYLEVSSPVVDAPTIGPRMAERLEKLGIFTVQQLLDANAASVADQLNHRRVDEQAVRDWQLQAELVCRIPNLRGHDAQMLVACDIDSPEQLATLDPRRVLAQVLAFAKSSDGARVLRGNKEPDLDEVNDWIAWSRNSRVLRAA